MDTRFLTDQDLFVLVTSVGLVEGMDKVADTSEIMMQLNLMRGAISQAEPKDILEFSGHILKTKDMLEALLVKLEEAANE